TGGTMFIDRVRLFLRAGAGGPGAASMRREPHNPKGGPDGGDGGRGGDVIVRVDTSLVDLARYVDHPHQRASSGSRGLSSNPAGGGEPHNPKGCPDGGDGGRGGDAIVRVATSLVDLARYVDHPHQRARSGSRGSSNNRHGSNGADLVLPVPDGTLLRDDRGLLA